MRRFQRQCRWCRCKHLGLSAPVVTIEVVQNQSGLHATVSLSTDPSRLDRLRAADACFVVVITLISLCEFSSFCRFFLHLFGIVKDCQDFGLPRIVIQKDSYQSRRSKVCSPCSSIRCESTLSIGMSTSSFFVSVFLDSLHLTSSSPSVAIRFSVVYFVVNRFFFYGSGLLCFCAVLALA